MPSHVINNMVQISLVWDRAYSVRRPNNNLKDGYGGLNALCSETKQNSSNDGGECFFENSPSSRPGTGKAWAEILVKGNLVILFYGFILLVSETINSDARKWGASQNF